jgi:organic radical activating enzyme
MKTINIQNQDRNVSPRDYLHLGDKLLVATAFRTIQGEGPYAGRVAVFLRLAGCNYGSKTDFCQFCDTSFQFDKGQALDPEAVLSLLLGLEGYRKTDILVVTGGEPTLQEGLLSLLSKAWAGRYFAAIQIETNGTQPHFFEEAELMGLTGKGVIDFVVSPKANERLGKYPMVHPKVKWWASCFKFVVSADPESTHHTVPLWALDASDAGKVIYVSPMACYRKPYEGEVASIWDTELIDHEATAANYQYAAQYALKNNLRLSIQMHLMTAIA